MIAKSRLLLCTDMDRTVIPNGAQPEDAVARKLFREFCSLPEVALVYVSGRHQQLVQQAIQEYELPSPDYVITDVGTKIYQAAQENWQVDEAWEREIAQDWHGKTHAQLEQLFVDIAELELQEHSKQNTYKLSYYLPLSVAHEKILQQMSRRLQQAGADCSLIWSIDEAKQCGLLDVLPRNATKLHSIEFLREQLGYALNETVFAGDSGNDLPVLCSQISSVLVANAATDVKNEAIELATANGQVQKLYLATGQHSRLNGNYAAGVLEGVWHFMPALRSELNKSGFYHE